MDNAIVPFVMLGKIMNLSMAVVTSGDTIIGTGGLDLIIFQLSILSALFV